MEEKYIVFIVDDEPIFLEMLKDELADNPLLEIYSFDSGEKCVENLYRNPDIVILDHNLSREDADARDGMEILDEIKSEYPDLPVIVLTGQVFPDITFDYIMRKEVAKYLVKSENAFNELRQAIDRIIEEKRNPTPVSKINF